MISEDEAIKSILEALHHPFNGSTQRHSLQNTMFRRVRTWWMATDDSIREKLIPALSKKGVRLGNNHISNEDLRSMDLVKLSAAKPSAPIIPTIVANLVEAQVQGTLNLSKKELNEVTATLAADATPQLPNPVDAALARIKLPYREILRNVAYRDILALPTIGDLLRVVVVVDLLNYRQKVAQGPST